MTRLQVELAKAKQRVGKAIRKYVDCEEVTLAFNAWAITAHAWKNTDIVATVRCDANATIKQVVQQIHKELKQPIVDPTDFDNIPL